MALLTRPRQALNNPISLSGVGGLAFIRGVSYIASGTGWAPLGGHVTTPGVGADMLIVLGAAWVVVALYFWAGMVVRSQFRPATSLMAGMYAAWFLVHFVDILIAPDWSSILNLSVYALMVPVTITLAVAELAPRPSTDHKG